MPKPFPPRIARETLTRRTALEWLGRATVVALSSDLVLGCAPASDPDGGAQEASPEDAALPPMDAAWAADVEPVADAALSPDAAMNPDAGASTLSFEEGAGVHPIYDAWPVRTVDRQDLAEILSTWTLRIDGLVAEPKELTFAELVSLPRLNLTMDFHCVEGWSVYDIPYNGVHLSTLLEHVGGALPGATHVNTHTIGGRYGGSWPLEVALEPHTMLSYGVGGDTLPVDHGFPLRGVVPRLFAYKSPKYITRLELTDTPTMNYWVQVGYPYDGEVPEGRLREGRY